MIIHNVVQGSDEWHELRARCHTASEAPAMMGASSKMRRTELLHAKKTLEPREYSRWVVEVLFAKGHRLEEMARPITERDIGEDLFPLTATDDQGYLLASFDGLTMGEDVTWEHKQWNEAKAAEVRAGRIPDEDFWQVVQQAVVSRAERCIYTVSDGTEQNRVSVEYVLQPEHEKALMDGWKQFDEDVAVYVPPIAQPKLEGRAPETLPALRIQITGAVTESNLPEFKDHALKVIRAINRNLVTDQHFADAEKTVKWCEDVEKRLAAAKEYALSQTATIEELFRAFDDISAEARTTRLDLEKLVKAAKQNRITEIRTAAENDWRAHVDRLNAGLGGRVRLPDIRANFAEAMKGKRTIATLQDAATTELARVKILANQAAESMEHNLKLIQELAPDHQFLFNDVQLLALKSEDDLKAVITLRVNEHKAAEEARLAAERERIRKEEQVKAQQEAAAAQSREAARKAAEEAAANAAPAMQEQVQAAPEPAPKPAAPAPATPSVGIARKAAPQEAAQPDMLAPEPRVNVSTGEVVPPNQPTDKEIIAVLAKHFDVEEAIVIDWLMAMDLEELAQPF
jgi:predicted phage-related endonuclease